LPRNSGPRPEGSRITLREAPREASRRARRLPARSLQIHNPPKKPRRREELSLQSPTKGTARRPRDLASYRPVQAAMVRRG
jgi:hypothetical protein